MIHFKFKLQLKFRNNENYSSVIVNFHTGYHKKFVNLQLKFRKSKSYHETKTAHWYTVTSLLLKPFSSTSLASLCSGFRNRFILNLFYLKTRKILFCFSKTYGSQYLQNQIPTHVSFFVSIFYFLYHFNSSFDAQNLPSIYDCSHVTKLPVSC